MSVKKIKIGIDFHGVINKDYSFYASFTSEALARGHEIHILTGGPEEDVRKQLEENKVKYSTIFAIIDFYGPDSYEGYLSQQDFKIPDLIWDSAKAKYCLEYGINIHIDDSCKYNKWFTTPYCHYDDDKKICKTDNGFVIDFAKNPCDVLLEIEQLLKKYQYF